MRRFNAASSNSIGIDIPQFQVDPYTNRNNLTPNITQHPQLPNPVRISATYLGAPNIVASPNNPPGNFPMMPPVPIPTPIRNFLRMPPQPVNPTNTQFNMMPPQPIHIGAGSFAPGPPVAQGGINNPLENAVGGTQTPPSQNGVRIPGTTIVIPLPGFLRMPPQPVGGGFQPMPPININPFQRMPPQPVNGGFQRMPPQPVGGFLRMPPQPIWSEEE